MGWESDAYEDGLHAWLAGNPAWPGWPSARPAPAAPGVTVLDGRQSHLHDLARRLADEAGRDARTADAARARRAGELLAAVRQELTA